MTSTGEFHTQNMNRREGVKSKIMFRITEEMHTRIKFAAESSGVSINRWLTELVEKELRKTN